MKYLEKLTKIIDLALDEDHAFNDITSDCTLDDNYQVNFAINPRQDIVLSGINSVELCFLALKQSTKFANSKLSYDIKKNDGDFVKNKESIVTGFGDAKLIFAAERVILNCLQHMSGISTLTNQFVTKLNNNKIKILDTRKTTIALREIEKYAVKIGGGHNHRNDLSDAILIKDNHISANSNIKETVAKAIKNNKKSLEIIVECDNVAQVQEISGLQVNRIMLDNMNIDQIKESIAIINHRSKIEISGGINLDNIANFRGLDIDYISIGFLTHSAKSVDIGLDIL